MDSAGSCLKKSSLGGKPSVLFEGFYDKTLMGFSGGTNQRKAVYQTVMLCNYSS